MSEQDTRKEPSSPPDEPEAHGNEQQESPAREVDRRQNGRGRGVLAGLALLLALGALVVAVWVWLQLDAIPDDDAVDELHKALTDDRERVRQLEETLQSLQDGVGELNETVSDQGRRLGDLTDTLATTGDGLGRVERRVEEVEDEVLGQIHQLWQREDTQREVDRELDRHLAMIETAALLRLGQERAELAQDFPGARSAYRRAASVLARADDPRLSQVRRLLAAELDALEAVDVPDWLEAQARLERLARQVEHWPLDRQDSGIDETAGEGESQDTGWAATMRSALRDLVRVRPRDETPISQEQLEMIRESLRLRLAAAELALGRRDLTELDHHLRRVSETLNAHFDTDDSAIRDALEVIERLRGLEPATAPTGLGEALARLREGMEST
jgi:uroporphyrin-III C-methyltransferase